MLTIKLFISNLFFICMDKKLTITEWAEEDRPREKLMRLGAEALSNAELLAILIGSGSTKESAVAVSYTHLTLPTTARRCRSRWSPYH